MKALLAVVVVAIPALLGLAAPAGTDFAPRPEAARPDGLLVLAALSPERAIVADPASGRTRQRELPGGTLCHGPLLALGDTLAFAGERDGRGVLEAVPLAHPGRRPRVLRPAESVVASAAPRRVWVGGRNGTQLSLREIDAAGRVHARTTTRVGGSIRPIPGPHGAFSPDGRFLAFAVEVEEEPRAAVIDLNRGAWSIVPGVRLGVYHALAWSPSGDWLYLAGRRGNRILASRNGTERARPLPIRTGGTVMSIATASRAGSAAR